MQPKTAENWHITLQATSHSWAQTSVENNTWHFGFVIFSCPVDYAGSIIEYTGCRMDLLDSSLHVEPEELGF